MSPQSIVCAGVICAIGILLIVICGTARDGLSRERMSAFGDRMSKAGVIGGAGLIFVGTSILVVKALIG